MKFELEENFGNLYALDPVALTGLKRYSVQWGGYGPNSKVVPIDSWKVASVTKKYTELKNAQENPHNKVLIVTFESIPNWNESPWDGHLETRVRVYYRDNGSKKFQATDLTGTYTQHLGDKSGIWLPENVTKAWFITADEGAINLRRERMNHQYSNSDPLARKGTYDREKIDTTFDANAARMLINARLDELKHAMISKLTRVIDAEFAARDNGSTMGLHLSSSSLKQFETFIYTTINNGRVSRDDLVKMLRQIKAKQAEMLR